MPFTPLVPDGKSPGDQLIATNLALSELQAQIDAGGGGGNTLLGTLFYQIAALVGPGVATPLTVTSLLTTPENNGVLSLPGPGTVIDVALPAGKVLKIDTQYNVQFSAVLAPALLEFAINGASFPARSIIDYSATGREYTQANNLVISPGATLDLEVNFPVTDTISLGFVLLNISMVSEPT